MFFDVVMKHVLAHEGGYSNIPQDNGGPTNFGIIQSRLAEYRGHAVTAEDVKNMTVAEAMLIYKKYYWDKMGLDLVVTFPKAMCIMDQGVNFGTRVGVTRAQTVLNNEFKTRLSVDGALGPVTAKALNSIRDLDFCREYIQASQNHYIDICVRNSSQMVFLKGWMNRTHRLQDLTMNVLLEPTELEAAKPEERQQEVTRSPYAWAQLELGTKEIPGSKHNPRVIYYHSFTSLKATTDEVSWCSSFMCAAHEVNGIESTKNAAARSWMSWGAGSDGKAGDVVVFWREDINGWKGHVAFVNKDYNKGDEYIECLGGNQNNQVCVANYDSKRLLGFRKQA